MKGSECLLEFKKVDTKCKVHWLWVTLTHLSEDKNYHKSELNRIPVLKLDLQRVEKKI